MEPDELSVEECRRILGSEAEGWSNERIEHLRDRLEALAHELYPVIGKRAAEDLEGLRWAAYAHRHGIEDDSPMSTEDQDGEEASEWPAQ
jgi:hypothetical protein